jgi:predicted DNA-binding transcriptional regulator AlpA
MWMADVEQGMAAPEDGDLGDASHGGDAAGRRGRCVRRDRMTEREAARARIEAELPLLLTGREAARVVGMSKTDFYRKHCEELVPGPVPHRKPWRWRSHELIQWVEAGCPPRHRWEEMRR